MTSRSVVEVSENLKQIVKNETLNITDIVLVMSVVEKIIDLLKVTQENENQVQFCSDLYQVFRYLFMLDIVYFFIFIL